MSNDIISKLVTFGKQEERSADARFCETLEYRVDTGMGLTVANALRRVLMSQMPGYSIHSITISGIPHEFSSIPGVKEDAQQLIMNLKRVVFKGDEEEASAKLVATGPCTLFASDIICSNTSVVNGENYICYVDKGFSLKLDIQIVKGVGVKRANEVSSYMFDNEIGGIVCDMFFSPVENVNYEIVSESDCEKIFLTIHTNGSISPEEALNRSVKILSSQFEQNSDIQSLSCSDDTQVSVLNPALFLYVEDIKLPVRIIECLKMFGVVYVGDMLRLTEEMLMKEPNVGATSVKALVDWLSSRNLSLGCVPPGWPPQDVNERAKKIRAKMVLRE
jgi:DNA-directed RNA polymerase subunit alpha